MRITVMHTDTVPLDYIDASGAILNASNGELNADNNAVSSGRGNGSERSFILIKCANLITSGGNSN